MKSGIVVFVIGALLLVARFALGAECPAGSTCVPPEDMKVFIKLLQEKKCLQASKPVFKLDPITIVTDKDGQTYVSGDKPYPYRLHMTWCDYDVSAEGKVEATAARMVPPTYGFRFRPKAYVSYLPLEAIKDEKAGTGIDAGALLDFFHWQWANVNAAVGVRSGGLGLGIDITQNLSLYVGYAVVWGSWRHNANFGASFALW